MVDPTKIEVVQDRTQCTSSNEIQTSLGLASYYQNFVEGLFSIAPFLNQLTQKNVVFNSSTCKLSKVQNYVNFNFYFFFACEGEGFMVYL